MPLTEEQEAALGRLMKIQALREGHRPSGKRGLNNPTIQASRKRDQLRDFLRARPGREFAIKGLAEDLQLSTDSTRRFCWEFVQEGWLDYRQTKTGYRFKPMP